MKHSGEFLSLLRELRKHARTTLDLHGWPNTTYCDKLIPSRDPAEERDRVNAAFRSVREIESWVLDTCEAVTSDEMMTGSEALAVIEAVEEHVKLIHKLAPGLRNIGHALQQMQKMLDESATAMFEVTDPLCAAQTINAVAKALLADARRNV